MTVNASLPRRAAPTSSAVRVTIVDVARLAGVSVSTASKVIKEEHLLLPATLVVRASTAPPPGHSAHEGRSR